MSLTAHRESLRYKVSRRRVATGEIVWHQLPRLLDPFRAVGNPTRGLPINEWLLARTVRRIVREHSIDLAICGPNAAWIGYLPADMGAPWVFDFLDASGLEYAPHNPWWRMEETYLARCQGILCVSHNIQQRAQKTGKPCLYLPNGADLNRFRRANGTGLRQQLGLDGAEVVSLIGLTYSPSCYFVEAIIRLRQRRPKVRCLLVGNARQAAAIQEAAGPEREAFIATGPRAYEEMPDYFAASDVGLYPVDEEPYYHAASPIKVFEYGAAGRAVVAPRLHELQALGLPHIRFAPPEPEAFAEAIDEALAHPCPAVDLSAFDWAVLSQRLETFLSSFL